jgi:hypothetical protein
LHQATARGVRYLVHRRTHCSGKQGFPGQMAMWRTVLGKQLDCRLAALQRDLSFGESDVQ